MQRRRGLAATTAGLAFATLVSGAGLAAAADLRGYGYGPPHASPYDDPRYSNVYGRADRPVPPGWNGGSAKDPPPRARAGCPPAHIIWRRLSEQGWYGFFRAELVDENDVETLARHDDGGVYRLTIDRCSGQVVRAKLLSPPDDYYDGPRPGGLAWRWRPYGWWRGRD